MQNYQRELQARRLLKETQFQERLEKDYWDDLKPKQASVNQNLTRAIQLDDEGRVEEACALYEKVLLQEPKNLALRKYIGELYGRMNMRTAGWHVTKKNAREERDMLVHVPVPHAHIIGGEFINSPHFGASAQPTSGQVQSHALYKEELDKQVKQQQAIQERLKRDEELRDMQLIADREVRLRLKKYNDVVVKDNEKLKHDADMRHMQGLKKKAEQLRRELEDLNDFAANNQASPSPRANNRGEEWWEQSPRPYGKASASPHPQGKAERWTPHPASPGPVLLKGKAGQWKSPVPGKKVKPDYLKNKRPASAGPRPRANHMFDVPDDGSILDPHRYTTILHEAGRNPHSPGTPHMGPRQYPKPWDASRPGSARPHYQGGQAPPYGVVPPSPGRVNMMSLRRSQEKFYDKHQRPDPEDGIPPHRRSNFQHPGLHNRPVDTMGFHADAYAQQANHYQTGPHGTKHGVVEVWPMQEQRQAKQWR